MRYLDTFLHSSKWTCSETPPSALVRRLNEVALLNREDEAERVVIRRRKEDVEQVIALPRTRMDATPLSLDLVERSKG